MKSTKSTQPIRVISYIAAMLIAMPSAEACGPYFPVIPTPKFFTSKTEGHSVRSLERRENLRLWQQLTSPDIPTADIAKVLYEDERYHPKSNLNNQFCAYIRNTNDREIEQFLYIAKSLEYKRKEMASPWYYPESKNSKQDEFTEIIKACKSYQGTRLKDRYALQLVRAQFAAHDYAGCVNSYDSCFCNVPDSNLMKRMAMRYVAGCWSRLGDANKANNLFVRSGDYESTAHINAIAYMAKYHPDSPELIAHIQQFSDDSARFCAVKPVAERVLHEGKAHFRGDWEFYLAYEAGEFHSDYATASKHMARAMQSLFSSTDLCDHAHAYSMKVDAALGKRDFLLSDLRWIEGKMIILSDEAKEWNRILQNIIYENWIPTLWEQEDYSTAFLLCSYADNLFAKKRRQIYPPFNRRIYRQISHTYFPFNYNDYPYYHTYPPFRHIWCNNSETPILSLTIDEMRNSSEYWNPLDYSKLSFRLLNSLTSSQLIDVKHSIAADLPLYKHLRLQARTDAPYLDEIIGTLALREERYKLAADYFARVPKMYFATLNIYKDGDLHCNPFCAFPDHWHNFDNMTSPLEAKYHFACRMLHYQTLMKHGKTPDERGMARLKYAIGRRNSFEDCWGLTQYWRGPVTTLFRPSHDIGGYDVLSNYPELYDYENTVGHEATQAIFDREVKAALAMLTTDAVRAEAEYMLFNLKTIVKRYPDTPTGKAVKFSCDRWQHWL